jgi:hypothetical protein
LRPRDPSEKPSRRARRTWFHVAPAAAALVALGALAVTRLGVVDDPGPRAVVHGFAQAPSVDSSAPVVVIGAGARGEPSITHARDAGVRFLRGYVAFVYGRASADELEGLSADLRRSLRRARVRVPPARARRTPRLVRVVAVLQAPGVVQVTAAIDDGDLTPYPVTAFVERRDGGWLVTHLADD